MTKPQRPEKPERPNRPDRSMQRSRNMHELYQKIKDGTAVQEDFEAFEGRLTRRAVEEALRSLPHVLDYMIKQTVYLKSLSTKFYEDNPELLEHKEVVAHLIEQAESKQPGVRFEKLLERIPQEVKDFVRQQQQVSRGVQKFERPDLKQMDSNLGEI